MPPGIYIIDRILSFDPDPLPCTIPAPRFLLFAKFYPRMARTRAANKRSASPAPQSTSSLATSTQATPPKKRRTRKGSSDTTSPAPFDTRTPKKKTTVDDVSSPPATLASSKSATATLAKKVFYTLILLFPSAHLADLDATPVETIRDLPTDALSRLEPSFASNMSECLQRSSYRAQTATTTRQDRES